AAGVLQRQQHVIPLDRLPPPQARHGRRAVRRVPVACGHQQQRLGLRRRGPAQAVQRLLGMHLRPHPPPPRRGGPPPPPPPPPASGSAPSATPSRAASARPAGVATTLKAPAPAPGGGSAAGPAAAAPARRPRP